MPLSSSQILNKGNLAFKKGNLKKAKHFYNLILKTTPNQSDANHNLGALETSLNNHQLAKEFYKKAINNNPNKKQFWIPEGCAHGFLVLSDTASFLYKTTNFYSPGDEYTIKFDDEDISIDWTVAHNKIILSEKDKKGLTFKEAPSFA